jgi:hypothetical protein
VPSLADELVEEDDPERADTMDPGPLTWGGMTPRLLAASIDVCCAVAEFESRDRLAKTLVIEGAFTCRARLLVTLAGAGTILF